MHIPGTVPPHGGSVPVGKCDRDAFHEEASYGNGTVEIASIDAPLAAETIGEARKGEPFSSEKRSRNNARGETFRRSDDGRPEQGIARAAAVGNYRGVESFRQGNGGLPCLKIMVVGTSPNRPGRGVLHYQSGVACGTKLSGTRLGGPLLRKLFHGNGPRAGR
jgi:hypothetical protein